jgi:GNAT superfamily N-acetyltransferase
VLALYDAALRLRPPYPLPPGVRAERDLPVLRVVGRFRGFVQSLGLAELSDGDLSAVVAAQRDFFAARREPVEWRTYAHDGPRLPAALAAAGFVVEHTGTVLVGEAATLAGLPSQVDGAEVRADADLDAIAAMVQSVWGGDWSWLPGELGARRAAAPEDVAVYAVVADGAPVSAAWVSVYPGTGFAVLTGGTTLPSWRGRGCYRALVAARASLAAERGARYLTVDASADSAPILRRLGFTPLTEVTSFVWTPNSSDQAPRP